MQCCGSMWCVYWVLCSVRHHGTQYTPHSLKHFHHNIAEHITMYFYRLIPQNCNFSKAQHTLPEDGPIGPKHVEANMRYFNCTF